MTDSNKKEKKPVAAYVRAASVEKGGKSNSIDRQIEEIDKYASENGLEIEKKYIDRDLSGDTHNRPALLRLGGDVKKANWKMVLISSWNRLATNYWDFVALRKAFEKRGIKIMSLHMLSQEDGL